MFYFGCDQDFMKLLIYSISNKLLLYACPVLVFSKFLRLCFCLNVKMTLYLAFPCHNIDQVTSLYAIMIQYYHIYIYAILYLLDLSATLVTQMIT